MSEENTPLSPAPEKQEEKSAEAHAPSRLTPGQQHRRQKSVFQYITVLFAAAFVLLLLTFLMERRDHQESLQENQEQIDNLQQSSNSAVQSLNNLVGENAALKEKVQALEEQIAALDGQVDSLEGQNAGLTDQLDKTSRAMDWFWQINEAFVRGRYTRCRELIHSLEAAGLVDALPKESTTDNERFSPADRYQEIYNKVF